MITPNVFNECLKQKCQPSENLLIKSYPGKCKQSDDCIRHQAILKSAQSGVQIDQQNFLNVSDNCIDSCKQELKKEKPQLTEYTYFSYSNDLECQFCCLYDITFVPQKVTQPNSIDSTVEGNNQSVGNQSDSNKSKHSGFQINQNILIVVIVIVFLLFSFICYKVFRRNSKNIKRQLEMDRQLVEKKNKQLEDIDKELKCKCTVSADINQCSLTNYQKQQSKGGSSQKSILKRPKKISEISPGKSRFFQQQNGEGTEKQQTINWKKSQFIEVALANSEQQFSPINKEIKLFDNNNMIKQQINDIESKKSSNQNSSKDELEKQNVSGICESKIVMIDKQKQKASNNYQDFDFKLNNIQKRDDDQETQGDRESINSNIQKQNLEKLQQYEAEMSYTQLDQKEELNKSQINKGNSIKIKEYSQQLMLDQQSFQFCNKCGKISSTVLNDCKTKLSLNIKNQLQELNENNENMLNILKSSHFNIEKNSIANNNSPQQNKMNKNFIRSKSLSKNQHSQKYNVKTNNNNNQIELNILHINIDQTDSERIYDDPMKTPKRVFANYQKNYQNKPYPIVQSLPSFSINPE